MNSPSGLVRRKLSPSRRHRTEAEAPDKSEDPGEAIIIKKPAPAGFLFYLIIVYLFIGCPILCYEFYDSEEYVDFLNTL